MRVSGLAATVVHQIRVRAVNSDGDAGAASDSVAVVPLRAQAGDGQVTLSWDDPGNDILEEWQYRQQRGSSSWRAWQDVPRQHGVDDLAYGHGPDEWGSLRVPGAGAKRAVKSPLHGPSGSELDGNRLAGWITIRTGKRGDGGMGTAFQFLFIAISFLSIANLTYADSAGDTDEAQAGVILEAGEIDSSTVEIGAFAVVIHGKGELHPVTGDWEQLVTVRGYVKAVDVETLILARRQEDWAISGFFKGHFIAFTEGDFEGFTLYGIERESAQGYRGLRHTDKSGRQRHPEI